MNYEILGGQEFLKLLRDFHLFGKFVLPVRAPIIEGFENCTSFVNDAYSVVIVVIVDVKKGNEIELSNDV